MRNVNLSAWALEHPSMVLYMIIVLMIGGALAFLNLGRAEDPDFTFKVMVVRTQWLYGLHGRNFVETMLRLAEDKDELAVVDDQVGSPTWTMDLSLAIRSLLEKGCRGTYHAANAGSCSWNEFARAIFADAGLTIKVNAMSTAELGRPAPRPLYSVLDCGKLTRDTGFKPPSWRSALRQYLHERGGKQ